MNDRLKRFRDGALKLVTAIAAFLTFLGGLDLSGIKPMLPDNVATLFATAFPLVAGLVHLFRALGDFLDDGQINGSFKCHWLAFVGAIALTLLLPSCGAVATVSGQPPPAVAVQRSAGEAKPFRVAEIDVQRAEASPDSTVWGLISLSNIGLFAGAGK